MPDARELMAADRLRLAEALGEAPATVMAHHLLRRGSCRAWAVGLVWSTGEGNEASQAVARRVGFSPTGTTRYVIRTLQETPD